MYDVHAAPAAVCIGVWEKQYMELLQSLLWYQLSYMFIHLLLCVMFSLGCPMP